ncbi:MAG: Hydrogenase-4 component E [bacterium ADurb.Bin431]|nr:MAG: Hydrogenase-4 component E [bacterium ADurb.Bin431]HNY92698.1 hydrogenase [bacterium]HOH06457.1 hydrogenase [bacterium]HOY45565.1 hydrogenase [bacterium]HPG84138.1 hydrogenase [bacterium]
MQTVIDIVLLLVLLSDLYLLSLTRLGASIRVMAFQGVLLALLPLLSAGGILSLHGLIIAVSSLAIKAILIPRFLSHAAREVHTGLAIDSHIPYGAALLTGMGMVLVSFWVARKFALPVTVTSRLWIPVSLAGVMIGLLMLIIRKKAISQVIGYLVLENGIYILGLSLAAQMPFLVELGVLLDVFAGVFIMGIIMNHIKNYFDDLDVDNLTILKD